MSNDRTKRLKTIILESDIVSSIEWASSEAKSWARDRAICGLIEELEKIEGGPTSELMCVYRHMLPLQTLCGLDARLAAESAE